MTRYHVSYVITRDDRVVFGGTIDLSSPVQLHENQTHWPATAANIRGYCDQQGHPAGQVTVTGATVVGA